MNVTVFGRGKMGGGLADLWEQAGHQVTRLGRDGGDVSAADVVIIAIPGGAVADAIDRLDGLRGKTTIDLTNRVGVNPPAGFTSNAEFIKSRTHGPTAKAFNLNYARLLSKLGEARKRPSNLWCGDDDARQAVEQLTRDAGYEPMRIGGLELAPLQEDMSRALFGISSGIGLFVYRIAMPGEL
jgi:8-hydroxy-5-deazaflavin:NADPH oxidoreductase